MSGDIEFAQGLIVKAPHPKAPDFVKASISIKRAELIAWLQAREGEWINLDVKESRNGKWYAAVNTWKPERGDIAPAASAGKPTDEFSDDVPF